MSDLNKAVLKVANSNPEFKAALQAELSKEADTSWDDAAQKRWDYGWDNLGLILANAAQQLNIAKNDPLGQTIAMGKALVRLSVGLEQVGNQLGGQLGNQLVTKESFKASKQVGDAVKALKRLQAAVKKHRADQIRERI